MRALEMMGQVHGHGDVSHGGDLVSLPIENFDWVREIADANLVDGDSACVPGILYVG